MKAYSKSILLFLVILLAACKENSIKKVKVKQQVQIPDPITPEDTVKLDTKIFRANISKKVATYLVENTTHNSNCIFNKIQTIQSKNQNIDDFVFERYGAVSARASEAINRLVAVFKENKNVKFHGKSFVSVEPNFNIIVLKKNNSEQLIQALEFLLEDREFIGESDNFRLDIVDLTGQIFSDLAAYIHKEIAIAHKQKNDARFFKHKQAFLKLLLDFDLVLKTREEFCFGVWQSEIRALGESEFEKELLLKEISKQIIHENEKQGNFRSCKKELSGLIAFYYYPRWEQFFNNNGILSPLESNWNLKQKQLDFYSVGDELEIVLELLQLYKSVFTAYF